MLGESLKTQPVVLNTAGKTNRDDSGRVGQAAYLSNVFLLTLAQTFSPSSSSALREVTEESEPLVRRFSVYKSVDRITDLGWTYCGFS